MQIGTTWRPVVAALLVGSAGALQLAPSPAAACRSSALRCQGVICTAPTTTLEDNEVDDGEVEDPMARARMAQKLMDEEAEASERAAKSGATSVSFLDLGSGPSVYPLAGVVGQESIKTALLLCAVNPKLGGVVISGTRGTAKSVMAKGLHELLPKIEVIKGSAYNIDKDSGDYDSFLLRDIASGKVNFEDLETEVVDPPFVQVPLDVLEDRLLGSVDVEKSVLTGETVFEPGLLARAHRGVLYVDDINLLDESTSNLLLEALSSGWVNVEREGLSVRHPCRPVLIATYNPEEAELREHLMDRIGVCLSADAEPLDQDERLEAVSRALEFARSPKEMVSKYAEAAEAIKSSILFAREYLKDLNIAPAQIKYLCEEAIRAGCQGHRGELFAVQVAKANAALNGEDKISAEDLKMGVRLAIAPRGTQIQAPRDEDQQMEAPPPPPPPNMDQDEEMDPEQKEKEPENKEKDDAAPPIPEEFMFDAEGVALDPDVMKFASKAKSGGSGSRGMVNSDLRGRYIKPVIPKGKVMKLAVDATMRAAAPYQKARRERALAEAEATGDRSKLRGVYIEADDIRQKKMVRKAGSLIIFVVDASGSMALNRMNAAKGAAIGLLMDAYQSRDQVCLVTFQGDAAQVILPPTRSIAMAKERLEQMRCGGGSPLAHALQVAALTGTAVQKSGGVGEVLVVCISDGRANVPLSTSLGEPTDEVMGKAELKEEVIQTAAMLGTLPGFKVLMLDSENKFVSTGLAREIADAAQGRYHYIPKASEVGAIASAAVKELKNR